MRSNLQDSAGSRKVTYSVTKARVEETRIVYPEFTYSSESKGTISAA